MKKLFAIFVMLSLLLTACAVEKPAEEAAEEPPLAPEPLVEEPPVEEAPAEEAAEEPAPETPAEEAPAAEEPAAEPAEEPKDEQIFEVGKGDKVTYKDTTFTVEDIRNVGNEMYLRFDADAYTLKLSSLNKPEILNSVEYEILDNTDYQQKQKVMLRLKPLKLGENEHLFEKGKAYTIEGKLFTLGEVKYDSNAGESAYFTADGTQYWVRLGSSKTVNGVSVTLLRAFYRQRQYAVMKIVESA